MKKGLIFATTLAMALGVGVAVGAHQQKAVKAEAAPVSTVYCKNTQSWWKDAGAAVGAYCWDSTDDSKKNAEWPGVRMTAVEGQDDLWTYTIPNGYDRIIFTRVNGGTGAVQDWGAKTSDLDVQSVKNCYTITSESPVWGDPGVAGYWSVYPTVAPEYHLLGTFNDWNDSKNEYVLTVDAQDDNHYTLADVELGANDEVKVCDVKNDDWYGDHGGNVVASEAGTYAVDFYVSAQNEVNVVLHKQEDPKLDPSANKLTYYVYDKTSALGAFAGVNVFGFDPNEVYKDMIWPGTHDDVSEKTLGKVQMYEVKVSESYSAFIMNGNEKQTVNIDATDHAGDVAILDGDVVDGKYIVRWEEASYYTDVPASEGYYVHSSAKSWVKANATKMGVGDELNHARAIRYSAVKDEEFCVFGYFSNEFTYFHDHETGENYKAAADGLVNIDASKDGAMYVESGVPAADGFYLQKGHKDEAEGWNYEDAYVMTETTQSGNKAYYLGLSVVVDDEIRVRSYFVNEYPHMVWANVGKEQGTEFGSEVNGNFRFSKAGNYDVYAKEEDDVLVFYISEAAVVYNITMTGVKFVGKDQEGDAFAQEAQLAYSTEDFHPVQPSIEGYHAEGYFTDPECTVAYEPHKFAADGQLYAKYMKIGYYVISGAGNWKIENAVAMVTEGIAPGNKAEASVTVLAKNETYSFVYYDGEMAGQDGLGEPEPGKQYSYAEYEDNHIKFTETGTYAVYWSNGDNKIYLNDGSVAFATAFMTATNAVCKADGKGEQYINSLKAVWALQKTAYLALGDGAKAEITKIGFDGGKEDGSAVEQMMARYHYIVCKYGSEAFENFIFPDAEVIPPSVNAIYGELANFETANNTTIVIVIAIAATSAIALGLLLILKKRKHN